MSFYTTVFAGSTPIGGLLFGWIASAAGVAMAVALGGIGAVVVGIAALLWVRGQTGFVTVPEPIARRIARPATVAPAPVEAAGVVEAMVGPGGPPALRGYAPSTEPRTIAALSPPKPNDVDSVRR